VSWVVEPPVLMEFQAPVRASRLALTVAPPGKRLARGGDAGQPVGVDRGPVGVGVLPVAVGVAPPVGHAVAGVPAVQVLAVAGLVVGGPRGTHADGQRPLGAAVHRSVHRAEDLAIHGFGDRRDRRVIEDRLASGEGNHADGLIVEEGLPVVALQPALDHSAPASPLRRRRRIGQHEDAADHPVPAYVVVLRDLQRVARGESAADRPAGDAVHHPAVEQERRVGLLDEVQDELPVRVGDRPGRAGQQREQHSQATEQHAAVGAGVGNPGVLDERAVGVEAVADHHERKHRRERVAGQRELRGVLPHDSAQRQAAAQIDPVRTRARSGVRRDERVRQVVVDRRDVVRDAGRRKRRVEQAHRVEQRLRGADLPVPPVVVGGGRRRIRACVDPVQAGQHVSENTGVAGQAGAGHRVGAGHRTEPTEGACNVR